MKGQKFYNKIRDKYNIILRDIKITKTNKRMVAQLGLVPQNIEKEPRHLRRKYKRIFAILALTGCVSGIRSSMPYQSEFIEEIKFKTNSGRRVDLMLFNDHAQIMDSYKFSFEERMEILNNLLEISHSKNLYFTSSLKKMESEWYIHNLCYNMGIARNETKDVDIDFKNDQRWYVNFATDIAELFYGIRSNTKNHDSTADKTTKVNIDS